MRKLAQRINRCLICECAILAGVKLARFIALVMTVMLLSCQKEDPVLPEGAERLIGEWRWLWSSGGLAGGQIFSEHPDDRKLKFDRNGSYACLCDPFMAGNYAIGEPERDMFEHRIFYAQGPDAVWNGDVQDARFLSTDTLILTDVCRDCYMHTYVRIQ